jgi:hypothetical protein
VQVEPLRPAVVAGISDPTLSYDWDEWKVREYFDFADETLLERFAAISGRGSLATTMAVGEWVCQRFAGLSGDPAPWQFLEAGWAAQMEPGRCKYTEIIEDYWRGVVRGPLAITITIANDALFCLDEDPNVALRAMWMSNLARHVLPTREPFDRWLDAVLELLAEHHPKDGAEAASSDGDDLSLGRPVARELFDTTRAFVQSDEPVLIQRFLRSVDPANPYFNAA